MQPEHLRELARILRVGGLAQLIERAEAMDRLEALCPKTLRVETMETCPGPLRQGKPLQMIHALLRRV